MLGIYTQKALSLPQSALASKRGCHGCVLASSFQHLPTSDFIRMYSPPQSLIQHTLRSHSKQGHHTEHAPWGFLYDPSLQDNGAECPAALSGRESSCAQYQLTNILCGHSFSWEDAWARHRVEAFLVFQTRSPTQQVTGDRKSGRLIDGPDSRTPEETSSPGKHQMSGQWVSPNGRDFSSAVS